jgi:hypothetical protein
MILRQASLPIAIGANANRRLRRQLEVLIAPLLERRDDRLKAAASCREPILHLGRDLRIPTETGNACAI